MTERSEQIRLQNLRRQIVDALYVAFTKADGRPLLGSSLYDMADGEDYQFTDSDEFLLLCRELKMAQLVNELPGETRRRGQAYGLSHSRWSITKRGIEVATESGKREPGVWDSRISGEGIDE